MNTNEADIAQIDETLDAAHFYRGPPPPYTPNDVATSQPVVHQTVIVQPPLRKSPTPYLCPTCHRSILTTVKYVNSKNTHMLSGFIFGFTCWCCLCCFAAIPYLIPSLRKAHHSCPHCDTFLGTR